MHVSASGSNQVQRHNRIRTNQGSIEKEAVNHQYHPQVKNADLLVNTQKRGAITVAKNSPRHSLAQMKGSQPRLPDSMHRVDFERAHHSSAPQQQVPGNPDAEDPRYPRTSQHQIEEEKGAGNMQAPRTPPTKEYTSSAEVVHGSQLQGNRQAYLDSNGAPLVEDEYLAMLQQ